MATPMFRVESVVDSGDAVTVETTGVPYGFRRGEHPADSAEEAYICSVLCSQSTSHAIADVCHCYYPPEFVESILDTVLANEGRFYLALPQTENETVLKRHYYPRLDERRRDHMLDSGAN
ncbi:MAG: hypothetical protein ACP5G7_01275 [Anaerolineae bacterium]